MIMMNWMVLDRLMAVRTIVNYTVHMKLIETKKRLDTEEMKS